MNKVIKKKLEQLGLKVSAVSIERLEEIKEEMEELQKDELLTGFQKWILIDQYILDVPNVDFDVRSIIITAKRYHMQKAEYHYSGKIAHDYVGLPPVDSVALVPEILNKFGFHAQHIYWLPAKRLSVRSGLAEYGRNNLTFIDGWGSLFGYDCFVSDMKCEDDAWRPVVNMDLCKACNKCLQKCPTGAILSERFLINNERCLSRYNENSENPYPDWIPPTAHKSIIDCIQCQKYCPKNEPIFEEMSQKDTIVFTEEETEYLLAGTRKEELPDSLREKIDKYDFNWFYTCIPRNLQAMLDNA